MCTYCSMNKLYVKGVQNGKKAYSIMDSKNTIAMWLTVPLDYPYDRPSKRTA